MFEEAATCGEQALAVAQPLGLYYALAGAYGFIAMTYLRAGEVKRGLALVERSLDIVGRGDVPLSMYFAELAGGYGHTLAQHYADGIALLEQVRRRDEGIGNTSWVTMHCAHLAQNYQGAGRSEEALATATEGVRMARRYQRPGQEAWAQYALGQIHARRDPPDLSGAREALQESLRLARELGMRPLEAQCLLELGSLPALAPEERHSHLAAATQMFSDMGMKFWLERARVSLGLLSDA